MTSQSYLTTKLLDPIVVAGERQKLVSLSREELVEEFQHLPGVHRKTLMSSATLIDVIIWTKHFPTHGRP